MANFHLRAEPYLKKVNGNSIVEIGSDRDEGSTAWFDQLAQTHNKKFYSVDVVDYAKSRFTHLQNTEWVISQSGSYWAKNELPTLDLSIGVLYLDNYDWGNYPTGPNEQKIIDDYASRGETWSTLRCQQEHLSQMVHCLPYMAEHSVVICDDTPFIEHAGIYFGKCGAVVPYLLDYGYIIVYSGNNGVILKR